MPNVTERKRAKANVERLKNYLVDVIESIPSALVGMNRDDTVTQWNKKAEGKLFQATERWAQTQTRSPRVLLVGIYLGAYL